MCQELIADHQVQRNVAKELMIDLEVLQVHEREPVLIGETLRARGLTGRIEVLVDGARISSHKSVVGSRFSVLSKSPTTEN